MARFGIVAAPIASTTGEPKPKSKWIKWLRERTFTMRYLVLTSALLLAGAVAVTSAETPAPASTTIKRTVYLDSVVLEDIRKSNPERYSRIQEVMASASEMCKPNAARTWAVTSAPAADCSSLFLKTSYPPKRQIGFVIGDTRYVANVIVRDGPALLKAEPDKVTPADQLK